MSQSPFASSGRPRVLIALAGGAVVLVLAAIAVGLLGSGSRPRQALALPGGPLSSLERLDDEEPGASLEGASAVEPGERWRRPGAWKPRRSGESAEAAGLQRSGEGPTATGRGQGDELIDGQPRGGVTLGAPQVRQLPGATRGTVAGGASLVPGAAQPGNDPGASADGSSDVRGNEAAEPFCGDGVVQGSEVCEPPGTPLCSDDCVPVTDLECFDCEQQTDCWEFSESCLATGFTPDQQTLCWDIQECVKDTNCADGAKPLAACFCGDLGTAACMAAPNSGPESPAGACADVIRDGMGGPSVTNGQVLARLINIAYAGGAAMARMNCQKLAPLCTAPCGF